MLYGIMDTQTYWTDSQTKTHIFLCRLLEYEGVCPLVPPVGWSACDSLRGVCLVSFFVILKFYSLISTLLIFSFHFILCVYCQLKEFHSCISQFCVAASSVKEIVANDK